MKKKRINKLSLIILIVISCSSYIFFSYTYKNKLLSDSRLATQYLSSQMGYSFSSLINERMSIIVSLKEIIKANLDNPEIRTIFNNSAEVLYAGEIGIRAIQVFPNEGVVFNYPESTNEAVLKRTLSDLINDERPHVREDVQTAIRTRKITLSGPYELRQGGLGLVARLAIFEDDKLWGISVIVFDIPPMVDHVGLNSLDSSLEVGLFDENDSIIGGNSSGLFDEPVIYEINLPDRIWYLKGIPKGGWDNDIAFDLRLFQLLLLIIILIINTFFFILYSQNINLETQVNRQINYLKRQSHIIERSQQIGHIGSWEYDHIHKSLTWSNEVLKILKLYDDKSITVENILANLKSTDRRKILIIYEQSIRNKKTDFQFTHEVFFDKDNHVRTIQQKCENIFDSEGNILFTYGVIMDVTEQRKYENSLIESKLKFELLINKAPIPMIIAYMNKNKVFFNEKFTKLFGYSNKDIPDIDIWWEKIYPDIEYRNYVHNEWLKVISDAELQNKSYIFDIQIKDGATRRVEFMMTMLDDISILALSDITEKELAKKRNKELQEQLNHRSKMDSIGLLAGGVAHDFNNSISVIQSATELIEITNDRKDITKYLNMIKTSCSNASDLTSKLLFFGRKSKIVERVIDLNGIIESILSILKRTVKKTITISSYLNAESHNIIGDNSSIHNSIMNLCLNSVHSMKEKGALVISTMNIELNQHYCEKSVFNLNPGIYCEIEVLDTGCGIPPENIDRIFEPFFTTKKQGEGTGLGLSAVYGCIVDHNGEIYLESDVKTGTKFTINLPISDKKEINMKKELESNNGKGSVLVIDDEELICELLTSQLRNNNFEVKAFTNSLDAISYYSDFSTNVDIIILDMIMPVMNGKDVFFELRKINPDSKIIISSGYTRDENIDSLFSEGLSGFIRKPFKFNELNKLILSIIR